MTGRLELGRLGVWLAAVPAPNLARGLEELGFGAMWIGGSQRRPGGRRAQPALTRTW
jgi:hypothetical protein